MKKRIISMLLTLVMCLGPISACFATSGLGGVNWQDKGVGSSLPAGVTGAVGGAYAAIKTIATIVAVFIVVFFGIKYLTAGAGDKAKTKEMMVPFLIGAVLIFMAPDIVKWLTDFVGTGNGGK